MAWQTPKTNWASADVPAPSDFNRIEGNEAQLRADLDAHVGATAGVHGATSAATPNTIVQRDPAGRFKAAAPAAADDVARKAETDAALTAAQNAQATADAALPASQYTAADVLEKLKTVDGVGSGLDADLLDGVHGSGYFRHYGDYAFGSTGDANNLTTQGFFMVSNSFANLPVPSYGYMWVYVHDPNNYVVQRFTEAEGSYRTWERIRNGATWNPWKEIWGTDKLRWNPSGYLEYNDGGVWRPVGGVKRIQRGTVVLPSRNTSGTNEVDVMISAVDTNKAIVHVNTGFTGTSDTFTYQSVYAYFLNSTTIRFVQRVVNAATGVTLAWQVEEHY